MTTVIRNSPVTRVIRNGRGPKGTAGLSILSGVGAPPSDLGREGEFFVDTTGWRLYGPKSEAGWGAGVSLVGPSGDDGMTILNGAGAPTSGDGVDGDFWIQHPAWVIYGPKAAGIWPSGVSLLSLSGQPRKIATPNYVLQASDLGRPLAFTAATPVSVIVPASLPVGFACTILQLGAGAVSLLGPDVNLHSISGYAATSAQYQRMTLTPVAADEYVVSGGTALPVAPLMLVSPRYYPQQQRSSAGTSRFRRAVFNLPLSRSVTKLKLAWAGWYADFSNPAETALGNATNIEASNIYVNGGAAQPLLYAASAAVSIASGATLWSDTLSLAAATGPADSVKLDFAANVPASSQILGGLTCQTQNGEGVATGTATLVAQVGTAAPATGGTKRATYGPMFAVGDGWRGEPVVLVWGDSISVGWEDNALVADARGLQGWAAKMADSTTGGRFGVGNASARGNSLDPSSGGGAAGAAKRVAALQALTNVPFTHIVCQLGVNTINGAGATSLAAVQALFQSTWAYLASSFPGVPIIQSTITPITTAGTSAWTDEAGQVYQTNFGPVPSIWSQINDWIVSNPTGIDGHIVVHDAITGVDPAKWASPGFTATLVNAVTAGGTSTLRLTAAPPLGLNLVSEPGAGANMDTNADYAAISVTPVGADFDVLLGRTIVKAHAAGVTVAGSRTSEGVHPNKPATDLMRDRAVSQKAVFVYPQG